MMANYSGPWGIRFSPMLLAQAGRPYNITLPTDTLNNFFNQRPTYATASTPLADQVNTPYGILDKAALPGETVIPVNIAKGPAAVAVNLRVSRGFGLGPKLASAMPQGDAGGPPQGGPPPGVGGRGGRGGGGGMGGGGGRGMGGGPINTGRKYTLTFSAQALNLFNDIDYGTPNGNISSPNFGRSTTLAGGIFSTGSAARRIFVQAVFSF